MAVFHLKNLLHSHYFKLFSHNIKKQILQTDVHTFLKELIK